MRIHRRIIFVANLIFSFSLGVTAYTNSSFIREALGERLVGIVYTVAAILTIYVFSRAARSLARSGNRLFFLSYGALQAISLTALVMPTGPVIQTLAFIAYLFSAGVLSYSFDIFFNDVVPARGAGTSRGLFLLLGNVGWIGAPLLTAGIIDHFGYEGTYAVGLVTFAAVVLMLESGLRGYKEKSMTPHHAHQPLRRALRRRTLRPVIGANFILQFFYAWMVVYVPIYLSAHLGFSWDVIGVLFAFMLTPFVILDYPLGRIADWLGSEKELMVIGFLVMIGSVAALAYTPNPDIVTMGGILFLSRVGAATVEAMSEIHFFKIRGAEDPRVLSVFRDLRPLAYTIAPLLGTLILYFYPFRAIFAVLVLVLCFGVFFSFRTERKAAWWEPSHSN